MECSIVFDPAKFDQGNGMRQEIEDFVTHRNSAPRHQDQPVLLLVTQSVQSAELQG